MSGSIGLKYYTRSAVTNENMKAIQNLFSEQQKNYCNIYYNEIIKILDSDDGKKMFNEITAKNLSKEQILLYINSKEQIPTIISKINRMKKDPNQQSIYLNLISSTASVVLKNISNSSGVIDGEKLRIEIISTLNALCGSYVKTTKSTFGETSNKNMYIYIGIAVFVILLLILGFILYKKKKKSSVSAAAAATKFGRRRH